MRVLKNRDQYLKLGLREGGTFASTSGGKNNRPLGRFGSFVFSFETESGLFVSSSVS